jgi:hypothetical protein
MAKNGNLFGQPTQSKKMFKWFVKHCRVDLWFEFFPHYTAFMSFSSLMAVYGTFNCIFQKKCPAWFRNVYYVTFCFGFLNEPSETLKSKDNKNPIIW